MKNGYGALLLATASTLGVVAPAAFAQTGQPSATTAQSDDSSAIIVTARRVEERLQDVPISITVFTPQQLANRNIVNPGDLALYTPSLSVTNRFGPEKAVFAIRGFNQDLGTQPSVAVYFAEVITPRGAGPTPGGNGASAGSLFDLQNIQVLKGPQGTLFGRNTTGGAILLVPQKPTGKFEGYVEGSIGDYDLRRVQAVVNVPLSDVARLRVGVDRMTREGYLKSSSGVGPDDFGNVNYWAARASLVVDLTPDLENYTIASFSNSDTHGILGKIAVCLRDPMKRRAGQIFNAQAGCDQIDRQAARGDGYYGVDNGVPDPFIKIQTWQVVNTTTWRASDTLTIKNIASYGQYREKEAIDVIGANLRVPTRIQGVVPLPSPPAPPGATRFLDIPTGPLAGTSYPFVIIYPGPSGVQNEQSTFSEELQFQGRSADDRLIWQAGGYLELSDPLKNDTQYSQIFLNCTDLVALKCSDPLGPFAGGQFGQLSLNDFRYSFHNYGFYAQSTYKLTDQLSLTGGIRYTHDKNSGYAANVITRFRTPNTPTFSCTKTGIVIPSLAARSQFCGETVTQSGGKPTWLVDVDYKPTEDILLYAKYSRGYRAGVVYLNPVGRPLETADPEKVDTYEAGIKTTFRGAIRGTFNVTGYYNDFTKQQIQVNLNIKPGMGAGNSTIINGGRSRMWGIEVDSSVTPFEGFRVDLSYAYLNAKLQSITVPTLDPNSIYAAIVPTAIPGQVLALSPKNRVSVTGTYTLPLDESIGRISVGATFTHTDEQFSSHADDAFVADIGFNPGLLPATDLVNLNLNWNSVAGMPIDLSLFATNVTKEKYHTYMGNNWSSTGFEALQLGEPRMYGARLKYRFGS